MQSSDLEIKCLIAGVHLHVCRLTMDREPRLSIRSRALDTFNLKLAVVTANAAIKFKSEGSTLIVLVGGPWVNTPGINA